MRGYLILSIVFVLTICWFLACTTASTSPDAQVIIPNSYFGMHVHDVASSTPWPSVPFGNLRLWDAHVAWLQLEPERGKWQWNILDQSVRLAQQHHSDVLLTLGLCPSWASARPSEPSAYAKNGGYAAQPRDIQDWKDYVRAVVTRYKGQIQAYEIWNEPNSKLFYTGSVDEMIELSRQAYTIIKEVDPGATIVSPAVDKAWGLPWLVEFLNKGGGRYVDVIGYHFYVFPQSPEAMMPVIDKLKQALADKGLGGKPIWDTELGWAEPKPFPSDELAAAYLARSFLLSWAAGIQRLYWYAWDNHHWVSLETTASDSETLLPAGQAYATIHKWLVGASMDGCDKSLDGTWTCHLHRGDSSEWVVWNTGDGTRNLSVPGSWHAQSITPLLGGSFKLSGSTVQISQVPLLITTTASK